MAGELAIGTFAIGSASFGGTATPARTSFGSLDVMATTSSTVVRGSSAVSQQNSGTFASSSALKNTFSESLTSIASSAQSTVTRLSSGLVGQASLAALSQGGVSKAAVGVSGQSQLTVLSDSELDPSRLALFSSGAVMAPIVQSAKELIKRASTVTGESQVMIDGGGQSSGSHQSAGEINVSPISESDFFTTKALSSVTGLNALTAFVSDGQASGNHLASTLNENVFIVSGSSAKSFVVESNLWGAPMSKSTSAKTIVRSSMTAIAFWLLTNRTRKTTPSTGSAEVLFNTTGSGRLILFARATTAMKSTINLVAQATRVSKPVSSATTAIVSTALPTARRLVGVASRTFTSLWFRATSTSTNSGVVFGPTKQRKGRRVSVFSAQAIPDQFERIVASGTSPTVTVDATGTSAETVIASGRSSAVTVRRSGSGSDQVTISTEQSQIPPSAV